MNVLLAIKDSPNVEEIEFGFNVMYLTLVDGTKLTVMATGGDAELRVQCEVSKTYTRNCSIKEEN